VTDLVYILCYSVGHSVTLSLFDHLYKWLLPCYPCLLLGRYCCEHIRFDSSYILQPPSHSVPSSLQYRTEVFFFLRLSFHFEKIIYCVFEENLYLLTYSLTLWYRILFEKLIVTQLVKKCPAFEENLLVRLMIFRTS
jgi:hypothetical protein